MRAVPLTDFIYLVTRPLTLVRGHPRQEDASKLPLRQDSSLLISVECYRFFLFVSSLYSIHSNVFI